MRLYFSATGSATMEVEEELIEHMIREGVDFDDEDSIETWVNKNICQYYDEDIEFDDISFDEISLNDYDKTFIAKTKYKIKQELGQEDDDLIDEIARLNNKPLNGQLDIFGGVVCNV